HVDTREHCVGQSNGCTLDVVGRSQEAEHRSMVIGSPCPSASRTPATPPIEFGRRSVTRRFPSFLTFRNQSGTWPVPRPSSPCPSLDPPPILRTYADAPRGKTAS